MVNLLNYIDAYESPCTVLRLEISLVAESILESLLQILQFLLTKTSVILSLITGVKFSMILIVVVTGSWDRDSWGSLRTRDRLP